MDQDVNELISALKIISKREKLENTKEKYNENWLQSINRLPDNILSMDSEEVVEANPGLGSFRAVALVILGMLLLGMGSLYFYLKRRHT